VQPNLYEFRIERSDHCMPLLTPPNGSLREARRQQLQHGAEAFQAM
jgi:hypothetical protein